MDLTSLGVAIAHRCGRRRLRVGAAIAASIV